MKKTIIVMPVANEESTIAKVIEEILLLPYDNLFLYTVIDSYSKDRTEEIIRKYESKTTGRVRCVFFKESTGCISCYLKGFKCALADGAEQIIEMDVGSHQPKELPKFIDRLNEGYDCVWGSRFMNGGGISNHPLYRRMLSLGGTYLSNIVLSTNLKDMTSGFEGFQRHVLENMRLDKFLSKGHMYQTEMRYYCRKYKTVEVPINYIGSSSSLKFSSVIEALKVLWHLKKNENEVMMYDKS